MHLLRIAASVCAAIRVCLLAAKRGAAARIFVAAAPVHAITFERPRLRTNVIARFQRVR